MGGPDGKIFGPRSWRADRAKYFPFRPDRNSVNKHFIIFIISFFLLFLSSWTAFALFRAHFQKSHTGIKKRFEAVFLTQNGLSVCRPSTVASSSWHLKEICRFCSSPSDCSKTKSDHLVFFCVHFHRRGGSCSLFEFSTPRTPLHSGVPNGAAPQIIRSSG